MTTPANASTRDTPDLYAVAKRMRYGTLDAGDRALAAQVLEKVERQAEAARVAPDLLGIVGDNAKRTKREAEKAAERSDWATQEKRDREHHYWRGYMAGLTRTHPLDWLMP